MCFWDFNIHIAPESFKSATISNLSIVKCCSRGRGGQWRFPIPLVHVEFIFIDVVATYFVWFPQVQWILMFVFPFRASNTNKPKCGVRSQQGAGQQDADAALTGDDLWDPLRALRWVWIQHYQPADDLSVLFPPLLSTPKMRQHLFPPYFLFSEPVYHRFCALVFEVPKGQICQRAFPFLLFKSNLIKTGL